MEKNEMDYETGKWLEKHDEQINAIIQVLIDKGLIETKKQPDEVKK